MSDDIRDMAEGAAKGLAESMPVYEDLLQPAVREVGTALGTVAKTINIALAPVSLLVWGYDKIKDYTLSALEARLSKIHSDQIITPDPAVAGPLLEALRYTGHKEELRELYANLLARSMDSETAAEAHPAFVEILKQITPDEAKILPYCSTKMPIPLITIKARPPEAPTHFVDYLIDFSIVGEKAGCQFPELTASYLKNLERLGLAEITYDAYSTDPNAYEPLLEHPNVTTACSFLQKVSKKVDIKKGVCSLTVFGEQFTKICIGYNKSYY